MILDLIFKRRTLYVARAAIAFTASALMGCGSSASPIERSEIPKPLPPNKIGAVVKDCAECPEMIAVPQVGHDIDDPGKIFFVGKYEVTWRQYIAAVRDGSCPPILFEGETLPLPIEQMDRIEDDHPFFGGKIRTFECYLRYIEKRTGKKYRIPTGEEWEHAARAGTKTAYPWGPTLKYGDAILPGLFDLEALSLKHGKLDRFDDPRSGNHDGRTFPVGVLKPNAWGLYDVIGNVSEITTDKGTPSQLCLNNYGSDPTYCAARVARGYGGHFAYFTGPSAPYPEPGVSLLKRSYTVPEHLSIISGYRLVRN